MSSLVDRCTWLRRAVSSGALVLVVAAPRVGNASSSPDGEAHDDPPVPVASAPATTLSPTPMAVRATPVLRSQFGLSTDAQVGVAIFEQRFKSNGTSAVPSYNVQTDALAVATSISYSHAIGRFHFGIDSRYAYVGQGTASSNIGNVNGLQTNSIGVGALGGIHTGALGGLHLGVRAGFAFMQTVARQNLLMPLQQPPQLPGQTYNLSVIPADLAYGLALGVGVDAPALLRVGNRALALHLEGGAIAPATRVQTKGLEEGARSSTYGGEVAASMSLELYRGLGLRVAYDYQRYFTHFEGQGRRDPSSTLADLTSSQHLVTVGFAYVLHPYPPHSSTGQW